MIGVFVGGVRIGSIMHFTDGPKHRFWAAWSHGDVKEQFKTKKAAVAWLEERHQALAMNSQHHSTPGDQE